MNIKELKSYLAERNILVNDEQVSLLERYMLYILDKNESINLTAIKNKDEYVDRMILDCALILSLTDFNNKKVIDIGTGAGYPGTVIASLTNAHVDLLDSTKKKLTVIEEYKDQSFNVINARAEDYAHNHIEEYDIATARAVSELPILLELILPLLKVGGYFIALKGPGVEEEIKNSQKALKKLNAHIEKIDQITLPKGDVRVNLLIKKDAPTPKKYPRSYNDIKARPL